MKSEPIKTVMWEVDDNYEYAGAFSINNDVDDTQVLKKIKEYAMRFKFYSVHKDVRENRTHYFILDRTGEINAN